ncbi:hypothetical protein Bbelb_390920 [Branchiostoma belcheri]|nr:hypothetical protein Bbelb_412720 [Branchiostoma belcheri]KAI8483210.1 hypothetical protein Bbelb_390920 [Branchiostoma belcheri]
MRYLYNLPPARLHDSCAAPQDDGGNSSASGLHHPVNRCFDIIARRASHRTTLSSIFPWHADIAAGISGRVGRVVAWQRESFTGEFARGASGSAGSRRRGCASLAGHRIKQGEIGARFAGGKVAGGARGRAGITGRRMAKPHDPGPRARVDDPPGNRQRRSERASHPSRGLIDLVGAAGLMKSQTGATLPVTPYFL